jgi:hypothetical protein
VQSKKHLPVTIHQHQSDTTGNSTIALTDIPNDTAGITDKQ